MKPIAFLVALLAVMVTILAVDHLFRRRRARRIARVGEAFLMNYSPLDRFSLTERLIDSPQWTMRVSDILVKDVLYATRAGMRCFVATVKCRWSLDQDPSRFVVRIVEPADHHTAFELSWESSSQESSDADLYRKLLSEWPGSPTTSVNRSDKAITAL